MQRAVRAEIVWGHQHPPSPRLGNLPLKRAVQSRLQPGNPDASLFARTDGDTALAARHAGAAPAAFADTSHWPAAAIPVESASGSLPRSTPAHGHTDCKPATAGRSEHSCSAAAPIALRTAGSGPGLLAGDGCDSVPSGRPWVVPGRLHATRPVLSTVRVAPSFHYASTTLGPREQPP
jgi:hypothetical protein